MTIDYKNAKTDPPKSYSKSYTLSDIRERLPIYDQFKKEVVTSGHEKEMDDDPKSTTNTSLHMRYDQSEVVDHASTDLQDGVFKRKYQFYGMIGNKAYSSVEYFVHDEEDTELSEIP